MLMCELTVPGTMKGTDSSNRNNGLSGTSTDLMQLATLLCFSDSFMMSPSERCLHRLRHKRR